MTARAEQETTITFMRDDPLAYIHTSNTSDLHHLRKRAASVDYVNEVRGGSDWGEFTVRAENFKALMSIRAKRPMSEAQRAARAANVVKAQAARAQVTS